MNYLLLFLAIGSGTSTTPVVQRLALATVIAPMDKAAALFKEGSAQYDSADYNGAIDKFTKALEIVTSVDGPTKIRLRLIFNIATAHEKAFTIDKDVQHLRQALNLYRRYLAFAERTGDLGEELTVDSRISRLEKQLRMHSEIESNVARADNPLPPAPTTPADTSTWTHPRNLGLGLATGGAVFTVTGIILAAAGGQLEAKAQTQVDELDDLGIPPDHPAWTEGAQFVASERDRGAALTGTGATFIIVGIAGIGVGAYYLVKAKRIREGRVSTLPALAPGFAGIQISGRF